MMMMMMMIQNESLWLTCSGSDNAPIFSAQSVSA